MSEVRKQAFVSADGILHYGEQEFPVELGQLYELKWLPGDRIDVIPRDSLSPGSENAGSTDA